MPTLNLASVLEQHARRNPARTAVVCGGTRLTYGEIDAWACGLAAHLAATGIRRGDHVALLCPNIPQFIAAYFGILKTGAAVVPLNVLLKPRELAYHLRDSDAKALICFEGTPELPLAEWAKAAVAVVPSCREIIVLEREVTDARVMPLTTIPTDSNDTAVILYTSGTTGQPKGAELTHLNMTMNAMVSAELCASSRDDEGRCVTAITLPLFHATAQTAQMNTFLHLGGTLVLLPRFDPAALLSTIAKERVTHWVGVPTMYWTVLKHAREHHVDPTSVSTLRLANAGGAPMPVELMKDFEHTFGVRIVEGYGLSETAPIACFNHVDRPSKPGTVGQPLFGVDVMCVDEHDEPVACGEPGEVVIRGHNVMKGYYKRPEDTAEAMRGGWFHTGDIGSLDADGYLTILDRKKDMILRGGFNVYPRELEEVMLTHPAISLVAVIGVPDERLGEEVKAVVVTKPDSTVTEDELKAWCKEQFAAYKYPRIIEFRDSLPMSATGKILKRELRQSMG